MYSRSSGVGRLRVPSNYSGSAFERGGYADMPPPAVRAPGHRSESGAENSFREREFGAQLGAKRDATDIPAIESEGVRTEKEKEFQSDRASAPVSVSGTDRGGARGGSLLSSLVPPQVLAGAFPFAHGIGSEEILIFALMLTVYLSGMESGEADGELILLLGLLLFAG